MKRLCIYREESTDEGTFGYGAFTDGGPSWNFLELPWRDNQPNVSCIPAGIYTAHLIDSPHFQRKVFLLENVPGRSDVEMHPANWGGDTSLGYYSDLRGCCAPGIDRGMLTNPHGAMQAAVLRSSHALDQIIDHAAGEPIEIEFINPPQ